MCSRCEYAKKENEDKSVWCEKYLIFVNPKWNCREVKTRYPSILRAVEPPNEETKRKLLKEMLEK